MGFLIGHIQSLEDGRASIGPLRPLTLGGRQGLLARHLPAVAKNGDGNWSLTARELLRMEDTEIADDAHVLFELASGAGQKSLLCLVDVCGRTMSMVTDALFHFKVLARIESQAGGAPGHLVVKHWRDGAHRYEQMRLEGGLVGGTWAWSESPQAIGATVLHPVSS
jgi:hypothetical protein